MKKKAVIALIYSPDRTQILLIKRRDVPIWVLPGGGVDQAESPENAICREVEEETGFKTTVVKKVGEFIPQNRFIDHTYLYECKPIEGEMRIAEETMGVAFFPLYELPEPIFHIHKEWIFEGLHPNEIPFKKVLKGVTPWNLIKYAFRHPIRIIRYLFSRMGFPLNSSQK